jgi:hypothetical protein
MAASTRLRPTAGSIDALPRPIRLFVAFERQVEALNLDIEVLLGAHGALEGRPFQSLVDFTDRETG